MRNKIKLRKILGIFLSFYGIIMPFFLILYLVNMLKTLTPLSKVLWNIPFFLNFVSRQSEFAFFCGNFGCRIFCFLEDIK